MYENENTKTSNIPMIVLNYARGSEIKIVSLDDISTDDLKSLNSSIMNPIDMRYVSEDFHGNTESIYEQMSSNALFEMNFHLETNNSKNRLCIKTSSVTSVEYKEIGSQFGM